MWRPLPADPINLPSSSRGTTCRRSWERALEVYTWTFRRTTHRFSLCNNSNSRWGGKDFLYMPHIQAHTYTHMYMCIHVHAHTQWDPRVSLRYQMDKEFRGSCMLWALRFSSVTVWLVIVLPGCSPLMSDDWTEPFPIIPLANRGRSSISDLITNWLP